MSEEQRKVLEMLANGTVSVEEANELLEAMKQPIPQSPEIEEEEWDSDDVIGLDLDDLRDTLKETGRALRRVGVRTPRVPRAPRAPRMPRAPRAPRVRVMGFEDKIGSSPRFDRLVKLGMFGVSAQQLKDLRDRFPDLTFDEVVKAAQFGVDPSFIDELKAAGLEDLDFPQIVKLKMFGISPQYIKDMEEAGVLDDLSEDEAPEGHEQPDGQEEKKEE